MKKHLITRQRDIRDCGVCCLQSIIKFYDGFISLEKLRLDTHTDKSGSTFFHILNAAKRYGFEGTGMKSSIDNIKNGEIILPAIIHLELKNGLSHFAVLYKMDKNHVLLMDPAVGFVKKKIVEFEEEWTLRVLVLSPVSKIIKLEKSSNLKDLFLKIIPFEKKLIIKLIFVGFIISIISIINTFYFKITMDEYNQTQNIKYIFIIITIFAIFHLVKVIMDYFKSSFENNLNKNLDIRIILPFIRHIFLLPLNFVKSRSTGEITSRISDLNNIKNLFSKIFITIFLDLLLAFISVFILYSINKKLFLSLLIVISLYLLISLIFSKMIYKKISENINYETELNSSLIESIGGILTIKNANKTEYILKKIDTTYTKYLKNSFKLNDFTNIYNFIKNFIYEIGMFIIISLGIYLITKKEITVLDVITFNYLFLYLFNPIKNIVDLLPSINYLKATIEKISEFYSLEKENREKGINHFINGDIEIKNLTFSYDEYNYLCKNFNMKIKKGEKIFLKGRSGSGKSTLCKLMYRLFEYQRGEIKINDININDYNLDILQQNIVYLAQKESLFTESLKENIIFDQKISSDKFKDIIKICEVEEIVIKKKLRYESLLLDGGFNLSGGEKQRICLARSLCKSAEIIILDEPLSEVEDKMENDIIKNILKYFKDKTIIYISHRNKEKLFDKTIEIGEQFG